jgi:hypothetical protein
MRLLALLLLILPACDPQEGSSEHPEEGSEWCPLEEELHV